MSVTRKSLEHTASENYLNVTKTTTPTIRVSHLLAAASVSALALALPGPVGVYGTRAWAQALPASCEDESGDTTANDGETVECEGDPTTGELDPVSTNVDDLTLIIGTETDPVTIETAPGSNQDGVAMSGSGPQSLTILNSGTTVNGDEYGASVEVRNGGAAGLDDLTIVSEGAIYAGETGLRAVNFGTGSTTITTSGRVESYNYYGIYSSSFGSTTGVTIDATGPVYAADDAINVYSIGGGDIHVEAGKLTSENGAGVHVYAYPNDNETNPLEDITIVLNDDVDAPTGAYVKHYGTGVLQIDAENIYADDFGITAQTSASTTTATLNLDGTLSGETGVYLIHRGSGDVTVTLGTNFDTSRMLNGIEFRTTNEQADIFLSGTRDDAGELTGLIDAETRAIDLHTGGADISVQDIASVEAVDEEAIYAATAATSRLLWMV